MVGIQLSITYLWADSMQERRGSKRMCNFDNFHSLVNRNLNEEERITQQTTEDNKINTSI